MKRKPLNKRSKKLTIPRLREQVWKVFSKYIRLRDSKGTGYGVCTTCKRTVNFVELDASHFLHGKNKKTYFIEDNVHICCRKCNRFLAGNMIEYTLFMDEEYGRARIEELKKLHKKQHIWSRDELEKLLAKYTKLLEEL